LLKGKRTEGPMEAEGDADEEAKKKGCLAAL